MKNVIYKIIRIVGTVLAFFNLLMFYAMRPCWSGISKTIGYGNNKPAILYYLPIIICVLFLVVLLSDLILKKIFNKNWLHIAYLAISFLFFVVVMVVIKLGAIEYMRFIWPKFFESLAYLAGLMFLYFLIKTVGLHINVEFLGKNAQYFRNALVLASIYSASKPEYLKGIITDATTVKNYVSSKYETIDGYEVKKYSYQNHTIEKIKTIKDL